MAVATLPYIGLILGVLIGCGIVIFFEPRYNQSSKNTTTSPCLNSAYCP